MTVSKESFQIVSSDYTTDFRDLLVDVNASSFANLAIDKNVVGGQAKCFIETIRILSMQNFDWRVEVYDRSNTGGYGPAPYFTSPNFKSGGQYPTATNPNNANLLGFVTFYASAFTTTGVGLLSETSRYGTAYATLFAYFASGLRIPILDNETNTNISGKAAPGGAIHANLVKTSGPLKPSGDSGLVHIQFGVVVAA
jgi:hypothetical protein